MRISSHIPKLALVVFLIFSSNLSVHSARGNRRHGKAARHAKTIRTPEKTSRFSSKKSATLRGRHQRRSGARQARARRRAEAARRAAIARQRALDRKMRAQVQSMIAKDDTTGEDPEIRRVALEALGNHAGTVVVMDPQTGRIYSIVNQQWALREGFKPCSTIKLVTGLAGLNEGLIDSTTDVSQNDQVDLTQALAHSKNGFFQEVGGQVGFDKMIGYARQLGLGEKTGINARNEFQGRLPGLKTGFALNRMSSHGDDFAVTALQLATLVSAMANGGKLLTPFVARNQQDVAKFTPNIRRRVDLSPGTWQSMVPGMVGAVNYGSGRKAYDPAATVAGKTGTCIEQGKWVGLFTSYAPLVDPRLAVVVIARGTDGRSHFPAAVAGKIYRDLNSRLGISVNLPVAFTKYPTGSDADEVEQDEEEAEEAAAQNQEYPDSEAESSAGAKRKTSTALNSKVKRVLIAVPARPDQPTSQTQQRPRKILEQR